LSVLDVPRNAADHFKEVVGDQRSSLALRVKEGAVQEKESQGEERTTPLNLAVSFSGVISIVLEG
jgi:recombinational DNA repair ATPase RecF